MASLYYTVYEGAAEVHSGYPVTAGSIATLSASSQPTGALGTEGKVYRVLILADGTAFVAHGPSPDATTAADRFALASEQMFTLYLNGGDQIDAITR